MLSVDGEKCRHGVPDDEPCVYCYYNRDYGDADERVLCEHNKAPGRCQRCDTKTE